MATATVAPRAMNGKRYHHENGITTEVSTSGRSTVYLPVCPICLTAPHPVEEHCPEAAKRSERFWPAPAVTVHDAEDPDCICTRCMEESNRRLSSRLNSATREEIRDDARHDPINQNRMRE